jgi:hypothetical protein
MVVPFGWRSIANTASCLEGEDADAFDDAVFEATAIEEAVSLDRAETLLLARRFAVLDDLRTAFADLDFDLPVAMRLPAQLIRRCHLSALRCAEHLRQVLISFEKCALPSRSHKWRNDIVAIGAGIIGVSVRFERSS